MKDGSKSMYNVFSEKLIQQLQAQQKNELRQYGKSDIDPPDYIDQVHEWYNKLFSYIVMHPPKNYVKEIVFTVDDSDGKERILKTEYIYFNSDEKQEMVAQTMRYVHR